MSYYDDISEYSIPLKTRMVCPKCQRTISKTAYIPMPEVRCQQKVPCAQPREKGQPRMVNCNEIMQEVIRPIDRKPKS